MQEIIKTQDYDRYITTLFTRLNHRDDIFAVISLNFELSKIIRIVSEPMIGMIRFAWWREAIEEAFNPEKTIRNHEILKYLRQIKERYIIEPDNFIAILNAKEQTLEQKPFKNYNSFKNYIEQTDVLISRIINDITSVNNKSVIEASDKIAFAYGIINEVRSAIMHFANNKFNMPEDVFAECGAKFESYGKEHFLETSKEAVEKLIKIAKNELNEARAILAKVELKDKQQASCPLLLARVTDFYIKTIEANDYNVFSKPLFNDLNPLQIVKLSLANYLGRY